MKKIILSVFVLAAIAIFFGCSTSDQNVSCSEIKIAKVLRVEGATSTSINSEIILSISVEGLNGCAFSGNFSEIITGVTTQINTTVGYRGCVCTEALTTIVVPYKFIKNTPGSYALKFAQPDNSFITHNIKVQ